MYCFFTSCLQIELNFYNQEDHCDHLHIYIAYAVHVLKLFQLHYPNNEVHGANMGPTWVLSAPDGPHVGRMNLAIRVQLN